MQSELAECQPLLTIAIPTYNRAGFLAICLQQLSSELLNLSEDQRKLVVVYISNNASTDDTAQVISKFQLNGICQCTAVNNESNIGGEGNVAQCYAVAETSYVWVLGDDDFILGGGLAAVLNALLAHEIDILSVCCKPYVDLTNDLLKMVDHKKSHSLHLLHDSTRFAKCTNIGLTFVSSLIVKTGQCSSQSFETVRGSNLPQLCWVLALLRAGKRFGIIESPIVAAKAGNTGGYGLVQVFGHNFQQITSQLLKENIAIYRALQNGVIVNFFPSFIMGLRTKQVGFNLDADLSDQMKSLYRNNWRYYIFLAPLTSLPLFAAKLYNFFLKVLRRILSPFLI